MIALFFKKRYYGKCVIGFYIFSKTQTALTQSNPKYVKVQLFYFISLTKLHWKKCKNSKSSKNIAHHNFSLQVWWHKRRTYERTVKICAALTSSKVLIGHLTLLPKRYLRILSSVSVTNFGNHFNKIFKLYGFANLIKTVNSENCINWGSAFYT